MVLVAARFGDGGWIHGRVEFEYANGLKFVIVIVSHDRDRDRKRSITITMDDHDLRSSSSLWLSWSPLTRL